MTQSLKEKIDFLRDNLVYTAKTFFRVRPKSGGKTVPLIFNDAQMLLHNFIESIRAAGELVRIVVCKGRQQGCCFDPDTKILTANLIWKPIKDIEIGEELVAVNEIPHRPHLGGKASARKMCTSIVQDKRQMTALTYKITLKSGKTFIVTGNHKFLVRRVNTTESVWRMVSQMEPGYSLKKITNMWGKTNTDDAWFGGILDGEGHISSENETGAEISASQIEGVVWKKIISYLTERKYNFRIEWDTRNKKIEKTSKHGTKPVGKVVISRSDEVFRLIGQTRPVRFLYGRRWWENREMPKIIPEGSWDEIISIEKMKEQTVIDLQTSSKTYIAEGYVSHNSTYVSARFLHKAIFNPGTSVFILAHMTDSTNYLFDMVKRIYNNLPAPLQPTLERSNRKELKFGAIDSEYALGTAGSQDIGRGMNPRLLHLSEMAYYENTDELSTGLMQGVATSPDTEIIGESTANGLNNMFYNLCMKGVDPNAFTRYKTLFIPWYIQKEYAETPTSDFKPNKEEQELMEIYSLSLSQIFWRRRKLEDEYNGDLWKFKQEYPCCLLEAFQSSGNTLIRPELIALSRKNTPYFDTSAPIILGVDGAGEGADRTSLVARQGRRILEYEVYNEVVKPMRLAGIIARKIDTLGVDMTFLDVAYGYGTRDRLQEMGYGPKTQTIHFGSEPLMPELYKNKRAQMFGFMKEWFEEGGTSIPDEDMFARDLLIVPGFKLTTSRGLLILPSKDEIRKNNGGVSPDIADATALTFAFPVKSRGIKSSLSVLDPNIVRAYSPFKSRRLAQSFVRGAQNKYKFNNRKGYGDEGPSELYIR